MHAHLEDLLRCKHAGAATIENKLVKINNENPRASWPVPSTMKLKGFLNHHREEEKILMNITLDVVNWYEPILVAAKEELDLKTNHYDMVVLGEPSNRKIMVDAYDPNGIVKLDKNGKKLREEKLVFGFVAATVKMLNSVKK